MTDSYQQSIELLKSLAFKKQNKEFTAAVKNFCSISYHDLRAILYKLNFRDEDLKVMIVDCQYHIVMHSKNLMDTKLSKAWALKVAKNYATDEIRRNIRFRRIREEYSIHQNALNPYQEKNKLKNDN
jgi:hypothetical protein